MTVCVRDKILLVVRVLLLWHKCVDCTSCWWVGAHASWLLYIHSPNIGCVHLFKKLWISFWILRLNAVLENRLILLTMYLKKLTNDIWTFYGLYLFAVGMFYVHGSWLSACCYQREAGASSTFVKSNREHKNSQANSQLQPKTITTHSNIVIFMVSFYRSTNLYDVQDICIVRTDYIKS